jgi:hypothetical protein
MEYLSDASFLGKLLVLPANVRLDWKVIARYKHASLLGLIVSDEGKKFYNIDHNWEFTKVLMNFLRSFSREVEPYCGNKYGKLKSGMVVKTPIS